MEKIEELNLDRIEVIQNRLASSLINIAKDQKISASDWVQGGWSRSSDKVDFGIKRNELIR